MTKSKFSSRLKSIFLIYFSLFIFGGYCICIIDSFGHHQHRHHHHNGQTTASTNSAIYRSTRNSRRQHHDRRRGVNDNNNYVRRNNYSDNNNNPQLVLFSARSPQDQEQRQEQQHQQQQQQPRRRQPQKSYNNYKNNYKKQQYENKSATTSTTNYNNNKKQQQQQQSSSSMMTTGSSSSSSGSRFSVLNKQLIQQETAKDVLQLLASTKGALSSKGGGGVMSTVNFSTSIHRLARHMTWISSKHKSGNERSQILSDPKFALLICSTSEALLDGAETIINNYHHSNNTNNSNTNGNTNTNIRKQFEARNLANIAWAIAKINIAPPDTVVPVDLDNAESLLRDKSQQVRDLIIDIAKQRNARARISQSSSDSSSSSKSDSTSNSWIPALSELCGLLIDTISVKALKLNPKRFQQQELSNLMWALATAQRPNANVYEFVVQSMVASAEQRNSDKKNNPSTTSYNNNNNRNRNNNRHSSDDLLVPVEWSIPLWVLAKSGVDLGHEEELLPYVNDMMANEPGFLERFKPQELSNSVWAAATIISKRGGVGGENDEKGASAGSGSTPGSEAALGILRHTSRELIRRNGIGYKSQELTNHAWAMATLGFGITTTEAGYASTSTSVSAAAAGRRGACQLTHSYTHLQSNDPEGDRILMEEAVQMTLQKVKQNIRVFAPQELNNICWVMARLGIQQKDDEILGIIGKEISNPRKKINAQDVSTTLWSMSTMEYNDKKTYKGIVSRFTDIGIVNFKAQEISNTLWALATAEIRPDFPTVFDDKLLRDSVQPVTLREAIRTDPVTAIFAAAATELIRRPDEFKTQEIKDVLWSFARIGVRHPKLFRSVAEYLVGKVKNNKGEMTTGRGLCDFNSQGLANLAYSFGRQAQLGGETLEKYKKGCRIALTGGRLAHFVVIYLDIGEGLLRKLFVEIAEANLKVHDNLSKCSSQDISNTVWAFALLGLKHTRYLEAVETTMRNRMEGYLDGNKSPMNRLQSQEMANSLWGMASLNYTPPGLLDTVSRYFMELINHDMTVSNISRVISRTELANLAWTVAVFGEYHTKLIEVIYMGIIGTGDRPDPEYLQQQYGDSGILPTHLNSLVYLQIMLDLELGPATHQFILPDDFPLAWTSSKNPSLTAAQSNNGSTSSSSSSSTGTNGIMELNTSGVQNRVSAAFDRINFGHVDEYILTMKDLALDYQIQMKPTPAVEILSLDIANIESKIGVEFDGPGHWVSSIDGDMNHILSSTGEYMPPRGKEGIWNYKFNWNSDGQTMNGSTSLKQRMFHKLGWRIINIPLWDWYPIDDNINMGGDGVANKLKQEEYCQSLLSAEEEGKIKET